jgi:hypothetical protein
MSNQLILKLTIVLFSCLTLCLLGINYAVEGLKLENEVLNLIGKNIMTFSLATGSFCIFAMIFLEEFINKQTGFFVNKSKNATRK